MFEKGQLAWSGDTDGENSRSEGWEVRQGHIVYNPEFSTSDFILIVLEASGRC